MYDGPRQVSVKDVPDPTIERPHRRAGPHHSDEHLRI
ncbi:MAG: hypothetical protein PGN29_13170 [Gordonia paraffinivorans]